jgi:antitoxin component of MazEF toxin-antitoxin module
MVVGFLFLKQKTKCKMIIKLKKFGGTLALRIPYQIVKELSLRKDQLIRIQRLGTWEFNIKIFPDPQQLISKLKNAEIEKILEGLKKNGILCDEKIGKREFLINLFQKALDNSNFMLLAIYEKIIDGRLDEL